MTGFSDPSTSHTSFVTYRDDLEHHDPEEDALINKIVQALRRNNEWAAKKYKHAIRDAHAKGLGVLRGQLSVYPNLPEHLRQGLFATPATYPVIVRLSSTAGAIRSDQIRGVRGMAIKVLGADGPRIRPGDGNTTQDFVLVNNETFPFADVRAYAEGMRFASALARTPDIALKAAGTLARAASRILTQLHVSLPPRIRLFARPNTHVLGETYHSAAPLRYGNYVAKISIAPLSPSVKQLTGRRVPRRAGNDAHRDAVVEFFRNNGADYEVRAQLCTNPTTMPIEDATVLWPATDSPHVPIAKITFPPQDANSDARRTYADDVLSFNSWNGLADHRPMGSINRLKLEVYDASSIFRHRMNKTDRIEPKDINELPD